MDKILSAFWVSLDLLSLFFFCTAFLSKRECKYFPAVFISVGIIIYLFNCLSFSGNYPFLVSVFLMFCASNYLYKGSWFRHFFIVIMGFLLIGILDTLAAYGGSALLKLSLQTFYQKRFSYSVTVTTGKLLAALTAWVIYHFGTFRRYNYIQKRWILLIVLFPIVSLLMLSVIFINYQGQEDLSIGAFSFSIALAVSNIAILYLLATMEKETRNKQEITLLKQQMEIQTQSIIALEKSYRTQRTSSHEFSHRLQMILNLLEQGESLKAENYIRHLQGMQTTRLFEINSHHPMIDAVLNQKYQLAKEKKIEMQVHVNDLSKVSLPTDAIVVLLSNLVDNAIEASEQCSNVQIIHFSFLADSSLFLSIENTSNPVEIVNGEIVSTKLPQEEHGYGLANVQRILQDLCAEYTYCYSEGWFRFVAEIPFQ